MDSLKITIVISCDSYDTAVNAHQFWLKYLNENEAGTVKAENKANLSIETSGIFRYIFCDYRLEDLFDSFADSVLSLDEFLLFEGLSPCSI